ncbi:MULTISPECIES: hypothetical protein [unclassified Achromobacter]|uniref:hypothetical protein n=1 Tax=unclassified Achromobacter TaxID=2626865 RepID=UPI000B51B256|nr:MULTISPECIES: hypothetical protein [unclassified Achromobacter]OWT76860.1 hypothetical protein CEY04_12650 [Achromobacter sp. HZ28]OWT77740.1 hypothetical protein CEY05_07145 [Achromobacter sp. HZ34]
MRYIPSFARHRPWAARALFALRVLRARSPRHSQFHESMLPCWQPLRHAVAAAPRHGRYLSLLACRPVTADLH